MANNLVILLQDPLVPPSLKKSDSHEESRHGVDLAEYLIRSELAEKDENCKSQSSP